MGLVFHPSTNTISRVSALAVPPALVLACWIAWQWQDSDFHTSVSFAVAQPVPFSHQHHVAGLGIDCRYCHTSVEVSNVANVPASQVCMNCHQQVWTNAALLQPVRDSYATGRPLQWQRVHRLPDFVFFNHSIHVNKGVGCETCHGRVDQMPLTTKARTLHMQWCLDCHRDPQMVLRPRGEEFTMGYRAGQDQSIQGAQLAREYDTPTKGLTDCVTCHR